MRSFALALSCLMPITLAACDGADKAKADPAKSAAAATGAAASTAATGAVAATASTGAVAATAASGATDEAKPGKAEGLPKESAAELKTKRDTLMAKLNEGRKHVKEGRLPEGIAAYESALKIDPHYSPALGELGWAQFKAGDYQAAHDTTHTALHWVKAGDNKRRGMLLYNAGRIAEAREQKVVAIADYKRSLKLRPNDTVQKRLDALLAGGQPKADPASKGPVTLEDGVYITKAQVATQEMACAHLQKESMCAGDAQCTLVAPLANGAGGMLLIDDTFMQCWHPFIKGQSGYEVYPAALSGQQGSEIDENVDQLKTRVVNSGGQTLWVFEFEDHSYERDWDTPTPDDEFSEWGELSTDRRGMIVCDGVGGPTRCSSPLLTYHHYTDAEGHPLAHYEAKVEFKDGKIVISDVKSEDETGDFGFDAAGTYTFAELFEN